MESEIKVSCSFITSIV